MKKKIKFDSLVRNQKRIMETCEKIGHEVITNSDGKQWCNNCLQTISEPTCFIEPYVDEKPSLWHKALIAQRKYWSLLKRKCTVCWVYLLENFKRIFKG